MHTGDEHFLDIRGFTGPGHNRHGADGIIRHALRELIRPSGKTLMYVRHAEHGDMRRDQQRYGSAFSIGTLERYGPFRRKTGNRHAQARVNAASTGLSPVEVQRQLDAGNIEYWASDADQVLERQVVADVGFGGIAGRWVFRAQGGIRLAGSVTSSRGLPVGVPGAILATMLELGLAIFIARRIVKRADVSSSTP